MLRSKGIIWLLLPFFIGLFCPFLVPEKARAEKENPPGSSSVATDKTPSAEPAIKPSEAEETAKKQTAAPKTNSRTYRQREAARNLPPLNESGNMRESEQDIMERVLELLNTSQDYWVKGDVETALEILDQAYAMLLDTNGDTDISRQKDDLRLLISKKILAIYTSKHTVTNGKRSEIPVVINAEVEREIRSFQTIERDFFIQAYQRASFFRPIVLAFLKKAGLPEELSWLPLVESGFKIRALSRARALGLWQFIPSTGYKYGLNRDDWIDERMDVEKSTLAAIGYLKDLHDMFGDWLTVLAAYNCGEGKVLRLISGQHINYLDRFWDLYNQLPHETARYVPRFLATLEIIKDPKKYGMDLEAPTDKQSTYVYETVTTAKCMNLQDIASHIDVSEDLLGILNAELRHKKTPEKEYGLKVPPESAEKLLKVMDEIPRSEKPRTAESRRAVIIRHKVKQGETVASIAKKYKTSAGDIRKYNTSLKKSGLKVGQNLSIPVRNIRSVKATPEKRSAGQNAQGAAKKISYKVKKGDTIFSLAQRFDTTVSELKKTNNIKGDTLKAGQILKFYRNTEKEGGSRAENRKTDEAPAKAGKAERGAENTKSETKTYVVKKGDSLNAIAKRNGSKIEKIMQLNNLSNKDVIQPGQVIIVR